MIKIPASDTAGGPAVETSLPSAIALPAHRLADALLLTAIIGIGLSIRLQLLLATDAVIDSDEAIVGLMAKHITEGRPWPVFYYGQNYMGSFEAIVAALSFSIFGRSNFTLKLVPLIFSLIHIGLVYALARRFVSRWWAHGAALLTAAAPSALVLWSIMARGGFIEVVVIGTLALIGAVDLITGKTAANIRSFLALGALLGLGWWINNQIIFYMAAIGTVFGVLFPLRLGLRRSLTLAISAGTGFILGGLPFWYANVFHRPRLATFRELFRTQTETGFTDHFQQFFTTALPIIFGSRQFWSESDIFPGSSSLALTLHAAAFAICMLVCLRAYARRDHSCASPLLLLLAFCAAVCLIFSASSFGWLTKAPRYLLPLYSVVFVLACTAASTISRLLPPYGSVPALAFFAGIAALQIASNYLHGVPIPGQPFIFAGQRVETDHAPLYAWLRANGHRHIRTNYWVGYRTAFETNEEITFSRFGSPRSLRIPDYEKNDNPENFDAVYVLAPKHAAIVMHTFDSSGFAYRQTAVGGYVVVDRVRPVAERGPKLALDLKHAAATHRADWLPGLLDGRLDTRWGSGMPQQPGMALEFKFDGLVPFSGLNVLLGSFPQDAPRRLVAKAQLADGSWLQLFDSNNTFYDIDIADVDELPRNWQIVSEPRCISTLRLEQQESAPVFDWSIAELEVFSSPELECLFRGR